MPLLRRALPQFFFFQQLAHCTGELRMSIFGSRASAQWITSWEAPDVWFFTVGSCAVCTSPSITSSIFGTGGAFTENRP